MLKTDDFSKWTVCMWFWASKDVQTQFGKMGKQLDDEQICWNGFLKVGEKSDIFYIKKTTAWKNIQSHTIKIHDIYHDCGCALDKSVYM